MTIHFQNNMDKLKKDMLGIASLVDTAISKAVIALTLQRTDLANEVMHDDDEIDTKEVYIEEECLKILALHQPVAADLRFVITVLKVNNDLERMGDLAVNIAERAVYLATHEQLNIALDLPSMAEGVTNMVKASLDALTNRDTKLARKILVMDDEIDAANRKMYIDLQDLMYKDKTTIKRAIHLLSASRHLERIADHATNIAEDVIYMAEGSLIRHRTENYKN